MEINGTQTKDQSIKITMITTHDIWGDLQTFSPMLKILQHLGDKNCKIDLVTINKKVAFDQSSILYGNPVDFIHENVAIHRLDLPGDRLIWPRINRLSVIKPLVVRIRTEFLFPLKSYFYAKEYASKSDIVYAYEIFGVLPAKYLSKKFNKPLVTRFQGTFFMDLIEKRKQRNGSKLAFLIKQNIHIQALKTKANLIIMTNDGTRGLEALRNLKNNSNIKFWRNGIDFKPSDTQQNEIRSALNLPVNKFISISVCRLAEWKRLERIIHALPKVVNSNPNYLHVFVGDGDQKASLEELVKKHNLTQYVKFVGQLPHKEVSNFIQASDLFISLFDSTNTGNPLQEALKLGKPILTYNVGDTYTLIENNINGILLETVDPISVAEEIDKVINDDEFRHSLILGAKETSKSLWSWNQRLETEYFELMSLVNK